MEGGARREWWREGVGGSGESGAWRGRKEWRSEGRREWRGW